MTREQPVNHLRALVRIPTISRADETTTDWSQFDRFIATLADLYPLTHSSLEREIIDGHSLLFRWRGTTAEAPTVFMAHYDVVSATDDGWEHPPFAATLVGEGTGQLVWGRGTLDDKGALVAILEAVEAQLAAGHAPVRDIYLSFGHNEETAGTGARVIAETLAARGIRPSLVLDEGGAVVERVFPGVSRPVAVVGVSEKGITSLRLTVTQHGGHASTPPRLSAPSRLARAIVRIDGRPFPARLSATTLEMIRTLGATATQPYRALFTQLWLTRPLLAPLFARLSDETSAMVRTTRVVTELSGSQAANAMAESASATLNVRIAVGSSVAETVAHVRRAIRDEEVAIEVLHPSEPSPVSPTSGDAWSLLRGAIEATYASVIVTPYVMLAASDSRHFSAISENVYRFSPFEMSSEERGTLHAVNERIRVSTFLSGIEFYQRIISAV